MFHRRPFALTQLSVEQGTSLSLLSGFEAMSRAILIGLIPVMALESLGDKKAVALVYFFGAILTLTITLNFSLLEKFLHRRWVVTLGGVFMIVAVFFIFTENAALVAVGIGLRSAGASLFTVCLSLYIMDYIGRKELTKTEARRSFILGWSWVIGPMLGVYLWKTHGVLYAFLASAIAAIIMILYFWSLRLGANKVIIAARTKSKSPLVIIPRYFSQKKLRIAYVITFTRACFWSAIYIYGPIYLIEAGYSVLIAGGFVSISSCILFFSPMVRIAAVRFGTSRVIIFGAVLSAVAMLLLGIDSEPHKYGIIYWVVGSIGGGILDVLGNIPFMRMVTPRERTEMTTIFSTWREMSEFATPLLAVIAIFLGSFSLFYFFIAFGLLYGAWGVRLLPKRL